MRLQALRVTAVGVFDLTATLAIFGPDRLRRIVKSHADIFVPGWNELMFAMARSNVSCTRSSARSTLPHKEIANARRLGTAASIASRTDGRIVMSEIVVGRLGREQTIRLGSVTRRLALRGCRLRRARRAITALFKLGEKVLEPVRNALVYHVIINALKNVPEPTLIFAAQAPSSLSCMGVGMHCRLWLLRFGAGDSGSTGGSAVDSSRTALCSFISLPRAGIRAPLRYSSKHNDLQNRSFRLMELFSREVVFPG